MIECFIFVYCLTFNCDLGWSNMNPESYKCTRLLKITSHNATGGAFIGDESPSNYQVQLKDEIQKEGSIDGMSVDQVTFPNLFPNVDEPFNEALVRVTDPLLDGWAVAAQTFSIRMQDGSLYSLVMPASVGTVVVVAQLNLAAAALPVEVRPVFTYDATGVLVMTCRALTQLNSPNWFSALGFASSPTTPFNLIYYGYPLDITAFSIVTVPPAFYTNDQLGDLITDGIEAIYAYPPGSVTINPAVGDVDQRYVLVNSLNPMVITPRRFPSNTHDDRRDLWYKMGFFVFPVDYTMSTIRATDDPNLFGETEVYLYSNALAGANKAFHGQGVPDSIIHTIQIDEPYGFLVTNEAGQWNGPMTRYVSPVIPRIVDLSLRNIYNEILRLPNNQQLTVTFRLWYKQESIHDTN